MARTKQSARQCTGDVAPRAKLGPKRPRGSPTYKPAQPPIHCPSSADASAVGKKRSLSATSVVDNTDALAPVRQRKKRSKGTKDDEDYVPTGSAKTALVQRARSTRTSSTPSVTCTVPDVIFQALPTTIPHILSSGPQAHAVRVTEDAPHATQGAQDKPAWNMAITILPRSLDPHVAAELKNVYCYMCLNGGNTLACDDCNRAVCLSHMPEIAAVPEHILAGLHFRCPSCHTHATQNLPGKEARPYYGLYKRRSDGTARDAYLPHWTSLVTEGDSRQQHVQVDTRPVIILSIRLASLDERSSPARFLYNYLHPWFKGAGIGSLRYIDIPFDIEDTEDADLYCAQWDDALSKFGSFTHTRMILFIHTHSHDEDGDLFFAPTYCSDTLSDWWSNVIPLKLRELATAPTNDLTIGLLACGAVINNERPRNELATAAKVTGAKHVFAFGAMHFQPVLTVAFFLNFGQRVLLDGMHLHANTIGTVFQESMFLARHTSIWFFTRDSVFSDFTLDVYDWTHDTIRPHGQDIGLQCPGCGSLSSRNGTFSNDHSIVVACDRTDCKWSRTFKPPTNLRKITLGRDHGRWRRRGFVLSTCNPPDVK